MSAVGVSRGKECRWVGESCGGEKEEGVKDARAEGGWKL